MYSLVPTILLMLPSFGFATSAQPISSLAVTATGSSNSNAIGPQPIDPRFSLLHLYQAVRLNEDHCLVIAVQLLGLLGSDPSATDVEPQEYFDDRLPRVAITIRSARTGGTIEARFLIWGLYLGIKNMIENNRFQSVYFLLRWEEQLVAVITIKVRAVTPLSLPGQNSTSSTDSPRRRSPPNQPNPFASGSLDDTSFNVTVPDTSSDPNSELEVEIRVLTEPLPKYNVIMALLDGILAAASYPSSAQVPDPVQVQPPPPYGAKLQVLPTQRPSGEPRLTFGIVALALRQIPVTLLLAARRWVAVDFRIMVDGSLVATGGISRV